MKRDGKKVNKTRDLLALEKSLEPCSSKGSVRVCLVYPNTYQAGMSSLGFQTLFKLTNEQNDITCERAFYSIKTESGKSFENNINLSKFDIIAFSISFENDYSNLVSLLQDAGIPLRSSRRNKFHPLVVAGGISCFLNPEPIASFIDCFLLGEAETFLKQFFDIYRDSTTKEETLERLATNLSCAYIPKFYEFDKNSQNNIKKAQPIIEHTRSTNKISYITNLEKISTTTSILTPGTSFKNIFLIETGKGCPHGCRFCSAGFIYRPPRFYSKKSIFASLKKGKQFTDKIGFVSAAVSDHPAINEICQEACIQGLRPSFSSFRADVLSKNTLSALGRTSIKTATIAPEAGSQKMRDRINKNISEEEILNCTEYLVNSGIINLKLYFLIGLPFEEQNDIDEIVNLIKKIKQVFLTASKKQKKIGTITISVNPFIPKPSTPFQWIGFTNEKILKKRVKTIKDSIKRIANVTLKVESIKQAKINAFLSRADRNAADVIEDAIKVGWTKALKNHKDYADPIIYDDWDTDIDLPWDIVSTGLKKKFLKKELHKAEQFKTTLPCPMIDCKKCKICKQ